MNLRETLARVPSVNLISTHSFSDLQSAVGRYLTDAPMGLWVNFLREPQAGYGDVAVNELILQLLKPHDAHTVTAM